MQIINKFNKGKKTFFTILRIFFIETKITSPGNNCTHGLAKSFMASDVDKPSLSLCKGFITNVVKRIDSHNRIKTDKVKIRHREFENTVRKEYTQKNLHLKHSNTMYSDLIQQRTISTNRKKVITPRQQVEKLVSDAANFDKTMEAERSQPPVRKKGRIVLNKTLLMNHLKVISPIRFLFFCSSNLYSSDRVF